MAKINLLPWREEAKKRQIQMFGAQMAGGIAITVLLCAFYQSQITADLNHQKARNSYLNDEITKLQSELTEISELETTKSQLLDRMEIIQNLQTQRPQIVHTFKELAVSLPDGMYLQSIRQNGQKLHITGQAESNGGVSEFMRKLDSSNWLSQPAVQVIETAQSLDDLRKFELNLKQTSPDKEKDTFDPTASAEYQDLLGLEG